MPLRRCRRGAEAVEDRDVRLSDLQCKIEELSSAKERAVQDSGSEVATLESKLATAFKDNSKLLRTNKWVGLVDVGVVALAVVISRIVPSGVIPCFNYYYSVSMKNIMDCC